MAGTWDAQVHHRAGHLCEYCRIPEDCDVTPFQIDHIIALKHGGGDDLDNLALTCLACNSYKGPNIAGIDFETRTLTRLYHPRTDKWHEHFALRANGLILGLTDVGRTTVFVLNMNLPASAALRSALIAEGRMIETIP